MAFDLSPYMVAHPISTVPIRMIQGRGTISYWIFWDRCRNLSMRYLFILLLPILLACGRSKILPSGESPHRIENTAYEDLDGNPVRLSDYKGKKIILHFWATWCKPCIEEMPSLKRAKPLLERENFVILMASDQTADEIKTFQSNNDPGITLIRFAGALSYLNVYALPTTFILDEKGQKIKEISGRIEWDSAHVIDELTKLD